MSNTERAAPPTFPTAEGTFSINYRDYDGRLIFGDNDWLFDTIWGVSGQGSIHVLNDPSGIKSVAVAARSRKIEDVSEDVVNASNFTSRVRTPTTGQIVLIENTNGYLAAVEIQDVSLSPEGEPGTLFRGRFKILTDKSRNFSKEPKSETLAIKSAVEDLLLHLGRVSPEPADDQATPGMGHNNPPEGEALNETQYVTLTATLQELVNEASQDRLQPQTIDKAQDIVATRAETIRAWVRRRFTIIEEGFFRQIGGVGAVALIGLGIWAHIGEKLDALYQLLTTLGH